MKRLPDDRCPKCFLHLGFPMHPFGECIVDNLPAHQKPVWDAFRKWLDEYGDCISLNENEEYMVSDEMWLFWTCFMAGVDSTAPDSEE